MRSRNRLLRKILGRIKWMRNRHYARLVAGCSSIHAQGPVLCFGKPIINVHSQASVFLGKNVTLMSDNMTYHINMHSPVKLMADVPGSVIRIGSNTRLNGVCIHSQKEITIGDNCLIAANSHIIDSNGHPMIMDQPDKRISQRDLPRAVHIGNNVWIGAGVHVLPGASIGDGSVITACSVVTDAIPPLCLAGGNPARALKRYDSSPGSENKNGK